jgi:hypothetical protein
MSANIISSLKEAIRNYLLQNLPPDPSGELNGKYLADLLIVYGNWRARYIPQGPRVVHVAAELKGSQEYVTYKSQLDAIIKAIGSGSDLTPHLSRGIAAAYEPELSRARKLSRRGDLDLLTSDWGIHHLHLSTIMESDGFVERTGDLLFAAFMRYNAYLIAVYPHGSWTELDLLRVVAHNWPDVGVINPIIGLKLAGLISDEERKQARNSGLAGVVEIDGKLFAPAGQTTAGTPIRVTMHANAIMHTLSWLDDALKNDPQWLDQILREAGIDPFPSDDWRPFVQDDHYGLVEHGRQIHYLLGNLIT